MSKPEPVRKPARASARTRGKADVFQAVADPTRRSMLALLTDKEMAIAELARQLPISRTAVNKHLHVLSEAGLVSRRKVGRETRYRLQPEPLAELKRWLAFFDRYWDEKLSNLKRFVEAGEDGGFAEAVGSFVESDDSTVPGGSSAEPDDSSPAAEKDKRLEEAKEDRRSGGSQAGQWQAWMD